MNAFLWTTLAATLAVGFAAPAASDDLIQPLAESGDWGASVHRQSPQGPPDFCSAINFPSNFTIRSDLQTIELRISDAFWSLPPDVRGSISIQAGSYLGEFPVSANANGSVTSIINAAEAASLFSAMDHAREMSVTVGGSSRTLSLAGSTKATDAFRACARL